MKIIIADSSSFVRTEMLKVIGKLPISFTVCQCGNVQETLHACSNFKPQAILMSADLIGGNSMDILEAIKFENVKPVVSVFAHPLFPPVCKQFLHVGADYVFDKSTEIEKLLELPWNRFPGETSC